MTPIDGSQISGLRPCPPQTTVVITHDKNCSEPLKLDRICRKAGISQTTYFNWKKKYDGLLPTEMRRLKQLEDENGKLRKVVADLSLDKEMLQDVIRRML
jgi:putative transposase